jgi:hypothetical protein
MTTTLKEGSEATAQASRLLRMPLRAPSPDEGAVDISQGSPRRPNPREPERNACVNAA